MKIIFILVSLVLITTTDVIAGFENDYIWQDRFNNILALAKTGDARAQYSLGEMYEKGKGTHKDIRNALEWYKRSANKSHSPALYKLGYFHFKGVGVQKDFNKAYEYLQKPANKGHTRAQFYLGKLYYQGNGVSRDRQEALVWFSRSSLGGYNPAQDELELLKREIEEKKQIAKQSASLEAKKEALLKPIKIVKKLTQQVKKPIIKSEEKESITTDNIIENLMKGGWVRGKRPADFLPSDITNCHAMHSTLIECLSEDLKRKVGSANIVYKTKSLIYGIKTNGSFEVAYRNKVLKIDTPESTDENVTKLPIKLGWQETEHRLQCNNKITNQTKCLKNKVRNLTYSRKM